MVIRCKPYMTVLIVLLTIFVSHSQTRILVHDRNGSDLEMQGIEIVYIASNRDKISEKMTAEVSMDPNDVFNKFYLIQATLSIDEFVVEVQNKGAIGVLCATNAYAGLLRYRFTDQKYVRQVNIPIFEIGLPYGKTLLSLYKNDSISNVTWIPSGKSFNLLNDALTVPLEDVNEWDLVFQNPGYIAWMAFNILFAATNIALAIWKLKVFILYYGGFRTSIACYVLLIELISNAIRIVYMVNLAFDNAFPTRLASIFSVLCYPFAFASYLLFTLYWHEIMTTSSVIVHPFITKMRIPFYVICALLVAINIVSIILLYTTYWDGMAALNTIATMVLLTALIVFYLVTVVKLLSRLHKSKSSGRKIQLKKTTIKVVIGVCFLFVFLLMSFLFVTGMTVYPNSYAICFYIIYTFLNAASMMNILAFEVMGQRSSQVSNKTASSTANNGSASLAGETNPVRALEAPNVI